MCSLDTSLLSEHPTGTLSQHDATYPTPDTTKFSVIVYVDGFGWGTICDDVV